jgi:AAA domain, putative AbiEii toxin, Type IV TA system
VRASLQVNPYCYEGGKRPASSFDSESEYNNALIEACVAAEIEVIAVTDHWSIDGSLGLLAAAESAGMHALPGFEATTAEGVHVLVIFPLGTPAATINSSMGVCGGSPGLRGSGTVTLPDLLARLKNENVLVIPAHANVASGLFGRLAGQQLERAVTDPSLYAVGVSPDVPAAARQAEIVKGSGPFAREHKLAFIHADDISHPESLATSGGSTWFKLSETSMANLAMALKAPETRVRVSDPQVRNGARLREVRFEGGFLDGVVVPFSDELTAIIGGRGTGKSTVVESVRFALDVPVRGKLAKEEHDRMVSHVLGVGAVVTVLVDVLAPFPNTYSIRRAEDQPSRITDAAGNLVAMRPLDLIDDVEIFGQHELAELAHAPVEVARMLARFAGRGGPDSPLLETEQQLADNRDALGRAEKDLADLDKQLEELPRLQAQKSRYDETGTADRLKVIDELNADEQRFADARTLVTDVRAALRSVSADALVERFAGHEAANEGRPALETHRAVETALERVRISLETGIRQLLDAADAAEKVIDMQLGVWQTGTSELREENHAVLRTLHEEGLEPKKYLDASKAVSALDQRATQRATLQERVKSLLSDRVQLMVDLDGHRDRLRSAFLASVKRATDAAGGDVVVQAARNLDRSALIAVLDSHIDGMRSQIRNAFEVDTFSAAGFVDTVRNSPGTLSLKYNLTDAQAKKVIEAGEPFLRELEEITLPDAVLVKLNIAPEDGKREYRALDDLSRGQKATALLLLLLSAAKTPLIIDQPEDDLDNRFIYRGIVRRLRELKGERQLIMTTHNANIPVLGDAELLIALESVSGRGRPIQDGVGSIDSAGVRRIAEDILEGGHEAFNQRRHRYGY